MARERKLPPKPKKPGDKYLRQARQWEYMEGKSRRKGRALEARPFPPVTQGVLSGRSKDILYESPPWRQVNTFPSGEDLPVLGPSYVVKGPPPLPGLAFPPDPKTAQEPRTPSRLLPKDREMPQEPRTFPWVTSGPHEEDSEAPEASQGLACPLLGEPCLGFQCQWFDLSANNCAIMSQLDYASGIRGELSILFEYLKYLDKRISTYLQ